MFHSLDTPNLMQRNPPTLAPPGAVVDYNSPDDIGIRLTAAGWITLIAALLCVGGRLINKLFLANSRPGYDDCELKWIDGPITELIFRLLDIRTLIRHRPCRLQFL